MLIFLVYLGKITLIFPLVYLLHRLHCPVLRRSLPVGFVTGVATDQPREAVVQVLRDIRLTVFYFFYLLHAMCFIKYYIGKTSVTR